MRPHRAFTLALTALTLPAAACDAPPAGPAWLFSDQQPVVDAALVAERGRDAPLAPQLDLRLAIADRGLGSISRIAVDAAGRIYALDETSQRILILEADGATVGQAGGRGEAPGQLSGAIAGMTIAGTRLLVADAILGRLTAWDIRSFEHQTIPVAAGEGMIADARGLFGNAGGGAVLSYWLPDVGAGGRNRVVRLSATGELTHEYLTMPVEHATVTASDRSSLLPVIQGQRQVAVADDGTLYLTGGDEYEILSLASDGTTRWVLRREWPREPMPEAEVERALDAVAGMLAAMGETEMVDPASARGVPAALPALEAIKVDGRGRLWVFPHVAASLDGSGAEVNAPVDVYDTHGELLYTGSLPTRFALHPERTSAWMVSMGDFIYGVQEDVTTGELTLVRHRIELPESQ